MSTDLSLEQTLLLDSCHVEMTPDARLRIETTLCQGVDWVEFFRLAIPHGVLPLVYSNLATFPQFIPVDTLTQLEKIYARVQKRNTMLTAKLHDTLAAFSSHGIRAIAFKGPTLAVAVYGDLTLREFHDLDIFISPQDAARAREILKDRGAEPMMYVKGHPCRIPPGQARGDELSFLHPDGVMVELQKELAYPESTFPLDFAQAWGRRQSFDLTGRAVPVLDNTDLLLYLCVHGCKHRWRRLNWVCDIAAVLRVHTEIDFEVAIQRAKALKCSPRFLVGLSLARDLLGSRLPQSIARRTRELRRSKTAADRICGAILSPSEIRTLASSWSEFRFHFDTSDDWKARELVLGEYWTKLTSADTGQMMSPISGRFAAGLRALRLGRRSP